MLTLDHWSTRCTWIAQSRVQKDDTIPGKKRQQQQRQHHHHRRHHHQQQQQQQQQQSNKCLASFTRKQDQATNHQPKQKKNTHQY